MMWFGEAWGAPVCRDTPHAHTPVGDECVECHEKVGKDDSGFLLPTLSAENDVTLSVFHHKCLLKTLVRTGYELGGQP